MSMESKWKAMGRDAADRLSDSIMASTLQFLGVSPEEYREGLSDELYDQIEEKTMELAHEVLQGFDQAWFYTVSGQ